MSVHSYFYTNLTNYENDDDILTLFIQLLCFIKNRQIDFRPSSSLADTHNFFPTFTCLNSQLQHTKLY